jgi:hypothetical protein
MLVGLHRRSPVRIVIVPARADLLSAARDRKYRFNMPVLVSTMDAPAGFFRARFDRHPGLISKQSTSL